MCPLRSLGSLVAGAVLLTGTSACSSTDQNAADGRVAAPAGASCVVTDPEGELILQPGSLTAGEQPLRLEAAALDDAVNLKTVEASTVAFGGRATIRGIVLDYPPLKGAGLADSLADWDSRQPLAGAQLDATDGRQAILVAVRLSDPERAGSLTGVTVSYTEGGEEASRRWSQPVLAKPPGDRCTVDDFAQTD